jgi:hypothetical protein
LIPIRGLLDGNSYDLTSLHAAKDEIPAGWPNDEDLTGFPWTLHFRYFFYKMEEIGVDIGVTKWN